MLLLALLLIAGCGSDEEDSNSGDGGGGDTSDDMGDDMGGGGGGDDTSDDTGGGGVIEVAGDISSDTTWSANNTYLLTDRVFITGGTLTIEAGTRVIGDKGSALLVTSNGRIEARGRSDAPIVFTSSKDTGARRRGDWGGVVMLGRAPTNLGTEGRIEGIEASDNRGVYGGDDPTHDCGVLEYVRIEFAGDEFSRDNELNGLTVGACGSATVLDYIQVHQGLDDGIEFFGGTANIKHAVITRAADDSFDWDEGWSGKAQYVIIHQEGGRGDSGVEADNLETNNDATPRTSPVVYNMTLIGSRDAEATQRGMVLRRGLGGGLHNMIITGFPSEAIDVRDEATARLLNTGEFTTSHLLFFANGDGGRGHFNNAESGEEDDDSGFDEAAFFMDAARNNTFDVDPQLEGAFNLTAPDYVPPASSPAASAGATPPDDGFFDAAGADFHGAIAPGGEDWTEGWTAYPEN